MGAQLTIISGGQTGVDRGALDAALDRGVRCGGWCPEGREAEDGTIPRHYTLTPLPGGDYAARTRRNVIDSDGTVLIHFGPPQGGTAWTLKCCIEEHRPYLLIDAGRLRPIAAGARIASFAGHLGRGLLNVAGPRASEVPGARSYAAQAIGHALDLLGIGHSAAELPGGPLPLGDSESPPSPPVAPFHGVAHQEANSMTTRTCHSCAAPLDVPGFAGPAENYCRHCTDESGALKKKKEVRAGIARWLQSWQPDLDDKEALKRARRYMRAMPAWAG